MAYDKVKPLFYGNTLSSRGKNSLCDGPVLLLHKENLPLTTSLFFIISEVLQSEAIIVCQLHDVLIRGKQPFFYKHDSVLSALFYHFFPCAQSSTLLLQRRIFLLITAFHVIFHNQLIHYQHYLLTLQKHTEIFVLLLHSLE
jgi:hypothetical protein